MQWRRLTSAGFCGVPGQACGEKEIQTATALPEITATAAIAEKVAAPTADAGSHFVDVGDVQSEALEGKVGSDVKRDAAVAAPVSLLTLYGVHADD